MVRIFSPIIIITSNITTCDARARGRERNERAEGPYYAQGPRAPSDLSDGSDL